MKEILNQKIIKSAQKTSMQRSQAVGILALLVLLSLVCMASLIDTILAIIH